MELYSSAKEYLEQGFSVIPVALIKLTDDKSRKPALVKWQEYQQRLPTLEELKEWFIKADFPALKSGKNKLGLAIITGKISGNLFVIDFDGKEVLGEFLAELHEIDEELYKKFLNTWVVETGKGFHYYFRVKDLESLDPNLFSNRGGIREGIDIRAEGGYVVAPPSIHPSGKQYIFKHKPEKIAELTSEEYLTLLQTLEKDKEEELEDETLTIEESKVLEIINLLKPIYKPGNRNNIILFLSGWLKKAGIDYNSARKIIEVLAEKDEEKDQRLYVLDRTYGLKGNPPSEDELKGKTGLQEIAEKQLGEEKSLELIRRLEEILGKASPFRDSVFSLIDFQRKLYYIANPKKGIIARAYEDQKNGGIVYRELIAECCPVKVTVYEDPLGGVRKFEIKFEGLLNRVIGPTDLDAIVLRLQAEGVVKHKRLIQDALSSIVTAFIRNGKAEIRRELEKPGFYYIDNQIKAIKWDFQEFSREDLINSLTLLSELRGEWYNHLVERFTTIIKWGLIAPFSYAIKQKRGTYGIHFPWLLLHGSANTGKSTLGKIIRAIWNLKPDEKGGSHIDTVPRFGKVVSESTFPILVNEVADVLSKENLREIIKSAIESPFARGRYVQGVYTEEPALNPMIFTTNKTYPADDALLRRFIGILFSISDRISEVKAEEFDKTVLPKLYDLRFLGYFVYQRIQENPDLLNMDWRELSTLLLRNAFEFAGLEVPEWIEEIHKGETLEDITEIINEEIRSRLLENINQLYSKHISKVEVEVNGETLYTSSPKLEYRLLALLGEGYIPWAFKKNDQIVITNSVLKVLNGLAVDSLKSLADRFGWDYSSVRIGSTKFVKGIKVSISDFVSFLEGKEESDDSKNESEYQEWDLSEVLDQ